MPTTVTLHVFSGRPNPSVTLSDADADQLSERLGKLERLTAVKPGGVLRALGYRGFTVSRAPTSVRGPLSLFLHEGIVDPGQAEASWIDGERGIESWLLTRFAKEKLDEAVVHHVQEELKRGPLDLEQFLKRVAAACPQCQAADAPAYNPGRWNVPSVQPYNNCYNYANDQITNTFAQPGRAHGAQTNVMQCQNVQQAAVADQLKPVANFTAPLGPGQGWYVAVVVWPTVDYHWYRQDNVGCWSHKPGGTAARNVDNSGRPITDPKTCDRGPYTNFCTYVVTTRQVVIR